jgi:hypothetical protein
VRGRQNRQSPSHLPCHPELINGFGRHLLHQGKKRNTGIEELVVRIKKLELWDAETSYA